MIFPVGNMGNLPPYCFGLVDIVGCFCARSRSSLNSRGRHNASISLPDGLFAFTTMYPKRPSIFYYTRYAPFFFSDVVMDDVPYSDFHSRAPRRINRSRGQETDHEEVALYSKRNSLRR